MKGKIHPFQIILSLLLILSGILFIFLAVTRLEQVFRDFSFIILNFVLFFGLMGLIFTWLGLLRLRTITIDEESISEHYLFGIYKRTIAIDNKDKVFTTSKKYGFIKHQMLLLENTQKQQIGFSNWKFLNYNALSDKMSSFSLAEEKLKMRSTTSDKIVIATLLVLFVWLMISTVLNLTF